MGKLTDKQQAFINYYVQSFNATDAARKAGYKGNDITLASVGYENLRKPHIKEQIDALMGELVMSANEALYELGQIARLDISDFLEFQPGIRKPYLDLQKAKEAGLMRFVKKVKYNAQGLLEFELYDKQAALVQIGKWQGLTEKTQSQNINVDLSQLTTEQLERIAKGEDVYTVIANPGVG